MDTLYTFWDNITHYKPESLHFWGGFMNSATKYTSGFVEALLGFPEPGMWYVCRLTYFLVRMHGIS